MCEGPTILNEKLARARLNWAKLPAVRQRTG